MKRHYFIGQFNWSDKTVECLDTETVHQIKDVLKINIGEEVVICDGEGKAVIATLRQINKKKKKKKKRLILCFFRIKKKKKGEKKKKKFFFFFFFSPQRVVAVRMK